MDIFQRFKTTLKIRDVVIDNNVFQLHYRVTALMLLCCAGLVASKQHFGDPIDCITRDDVPNKLMDTYCWIHSTFTLSAACNKTVGVEIAHPCVDKFSSSSEERVYHKYYQWVYFVLFFQAAFFYAPHFFWKSFENKLLYKLTDDMRDPLFKISEKDRRFKAKNVVNYLIRNSGNHQNYYYYFSLFELANLINVVAQIYVVDEFLGGTFTSYGLDVINYSSMDQEDRVDPMVRVFPRMTKCTFNRFGPSGDVQKYDALCILPLNIINEKIYIIMWFWFVFLGLVSSAWLIYRLMTYLNPRWRLKVLVHKASLTNTRKLDIVLDNCDIGDWFLLYMMCKNTDAQWFRYIVHRLHWQLTNKKGAFRQNGLEKELPPVFKGGRKNNRRTPSTEAEQELMPPPGDDEYFDDEEDNELQFTDDSDVEKGSSKAVKKV